MIIGITGKNCSGKGEFAAYLKDLGYTYYSLSDEIREELKQNNIPESRENLIQMGNKLRIKYGAAVLAERLIKKININQNYVIDSVRNPAEVKILKTLKGFIFVEIRADDKIRYERMCLRGRCGDADSFEEFLAYEKREMNNKNSNYQQLDKTIKMADVVIENNNDLENFRKQINNFLKKKLMNSKRPGWDEYFMSIAKVVASRSNCMKRNVAAIIVKDKRIISTGYNGTPRGVKNCNENGCPRCNNFSASGELLNECLCSHAEENAITQAAYHGVCIKDAVLYSTFSPCLMCTKMIINSGIKEVVYSDEYPVSDLVKNLYKEAGVHLRKINI